MSIKNLTTLELVKIQYISKAGNAMLNLQHIDPRLKSEILVVLAALANCEERLRDLYPRINSHFMEIKANLKKWR